MNRTVKVLLIFVAIGVLAGFVVVRGINARIKASAIVKQETLDLAIPSVSTISPKHGASKDEIVLPGNMMAFIDAPIYARTSGYLKKWGADIGQHVKAGQLLAEIESPEIDQQLSQARADLATAEANLKLSQITATRYQELLKLDAISRQETDTAVGDFEAKKAILASGKANVSRLEQLVSFEKVTAPFDGVITARNTDIGALINAGSGATAQELFHLAATDKLRVFISVPQMYSQAAGPGVTADLTLAEMPSRRFAGKVARTAQSIDATTRTLLTEVDIDNRSGVLLPGSYVQVHIRLPHGATALVLPVTALIFRSEGMQVAVVRDGKAELIPVTLGRDFGTEVEVTSGITEQDAVINNPPDSLTAGGQVRVEPAGGER
ncbi:MAG: efflux RND transporter periplasmic adaptor subunit [Acidobacteriia bacterium]|nr:efflux RND transporter periplasmic adaptor subunit [Terriglobia bacterium]